MHILLVFNFAILLETNDIHESFVRRGILTSTKFYDFERIRRNIKC